MSYLIVLEVLMGICKDEAPGYSSAISKCDCAPGCGGECAATDASSYDIVNHCVEARGYGRIVVISFLICSRYKRAHATSSYGA